MGIAWPELPGHRLQVDAGRMHRVHDEVGQADQVERRHQRPEEKVYVHRQQREDREQCGGEIAVRRR